MPLGGGNVGTGYVPIKPDVEGFGRDLEAGLEREGTPAAKRAGENIQRAAMGAFAAGAATIGKSVFDFAGFDKGMREVFTLLPGISGDAMAAMSDQAKQFSADFGVLPTETIPALYEALGAGVPADNVFDFLETSQKLARGGVTELATAVDGLSSVTNAYGPAMIDAERASDIMFKTVGLGKGTLDEVAGSLFNVTPIAAAFGVKFEDVGAAIAALTAQGTPVSVATTQIRQVLAELGKEGTKVSDIFKERTGKSFQQFIADGGNLSNALHVIDDAAFESGASIVDMFGSIEAGQAAMGLMKDGGETFFDFTNQMQDAAGSTQEAFDTMNEGLSATWDRLRARFAVSLINIGESLAPSIEVIGEALAGLLDIFAKIPGPAQAAILTIGTGLAGIVAFAKPIMGTVTAVGQLSKALMLLAANPWTLVIIAAIGLGILLVKNWDTVKAAAITTWKAVSQAVMTAVTAVKTAVLTAVQAVWYAIQGAWNAITVATVATWQAIQGATAAVWNFLVSAWNTVRAVVVGVWNALWSAAQTVWNGIASAIQGATNLATSIINGFLSSVQSVFGSVKSVISGVVDFIVGIPGRIIGAFSGLAERIAGPIREGFYKVVDAYNATIARLPGFGSIGTIKGSATLAPRGISAPAASGRITLGITRTFATGTVARMPTVGVFGEYPGARRDPEIVSPVSLMRSTLLEALAGAETAGSGATLIVQGPLIGEATIRDDRDIVTLSRELAREVERRQRGAGKRVGGVMVPLT